MNKLVRTTLALVALGASVAATAAPFDAADRERRERNREELMARHGMPAAAASDRRMSHDRDDDRRGERSSLRDKTHRAADGTRSFTHRQAEKLRDFGDRQNRKHGRTSSPAKDPYKHGPQ